jgi:cytochrome c oxidase subunit II
MGGTTVKADEQYIRNSILNPSSQVVEGFQPIMPTFKGQVTEEQLNSLVAYIKSLSPNAAPAANKPAANKPAANAAANSNR